MLVNVMAVLGDVGVLVKEKYLNVPSCWCTVDYVMGRMQHCYVSS